MSTRRRTDKEFSHHPFRDLKKLIKAKQKELPQLPPKSEKKANDEDVFLNAMKEVEEIREFRELPVYDKPARHSCKSGSSDSETLKALESIIEGRQPISLPDTEEFVEWINNEYRTDILDRLHEGFYSVQDCLDLHGLILEDAEVEVEYFIRESLRKGHQCIKIIHGRGLRSPDGPVLKKAVVKWLLSRYHKHIIAFVTARQSDGGLGALYILFK